jgi:integrase
VTADWLPRKGRVPAGYYDEARAHVRAAEMVREHADELAGAAAVQSSARAEAERPRTFRELAADWRHHAERVKRLKPSTLANYDDMLREPGIARKRGVGVSPGHIMTALGDQPAVEITSADIDSVSETIAATGVSGRTVNAHREMIRAIFNFGIKQSEATRNAAGRRAGQSGHDCGLAVNPARNATVYRDSKSDTLAYYRPEEIEAVARALQTGAHRAGRLAFGGVDDGGLRAAQDHQDGEAVRLSAYSGLRLGELLALRWSDVDWSGVP